LYDARVKDLSDDNEPNALDSLRALVEETEEQDDPSDTTGNLLVSALAMLAGAAVVGVVGWWLLKGGLAAEHDWAKEHHPHHPRDQGTNPGILLMLAGSGGLFGAAVLAIFALVSVSKIVMKRMGS
jgi:hypothetical protein